MKRRPPGQHRGVLRMVVLALCTAVIPVALPAAPAAAATTFDGTLAGPSVAATYPSGSEWDDANDRLVVADTGLDKIEFYDLTITGTPSTGSYDKTGQFGNHGTGNGQFDSPRDVAIGGGGAIYVADAGNNRLQKFDADGTFLWTTPGVGTCNTCLNTPIGATWDAANGVVLVASTGQNLIKAFNPDGTLAWRSPNSPNPLANFAPRDVVRGPDNRIWLSDYKHHMVKAYNVTAAGVWTTTPAITLGTGTQGTAPNQIAFPYNIDFSLDGNTVYIADTGQNRVVRFDLSGPTPVALTPIGGNCPQNPDPCVDPPGDLGTIDTLRRVNVDEQGRLITADFWGNGFQVWSAAGAPLLQVELFRPPAPGFAQAFGVAVSDDGSTVIGVDRLNQRIEKFVNGAFVREAGARGVALKSFSWPEAVSIDPTDGTVWVGDTRNDRIVQWKADLSGPLAKFGASVVAPAGPGEFTYIEDLDVAPNGAVYVADTNNNRIQVLANGSSTFTVLGGATLNHPMGVAVSSNGNDLYVADSGADRIVRLSAALALIESFGSRGDGNMQFFQPHTLDTAGDTLYVADA